MHSRVLRAAASCLVLALCAALFAPHSNAAPATTGEVLHGAYESNLVEAAAGDFALGDFDEDGILDVVVPNNVSAYGYFYTFSVALGLPAGRFAPPITLTGGANPWFVTLADLNADGHLDIVTANYGIDRNGSRDVSAFLGHGDGTFAPEVRSTVMYFPGKPALGDVNSDGIPDLVVGGTYSPVVYLFLGTGTGVFTAYGPLLNKANAWPVLGDFNADGKCDLVIGCSVGVLYFAGHGDASFSSPVTIDPVACTRVASARFTADAFDDLATNGSPGWRILSGHGDGTFAPAISGSTGLSLPSEFAAGDLDGDGIADLAFTSYSRGTESFVLAPALGGTVNSQVPSPAWVQALGIADLDQNGRGEILSITGEEVLARQIFTTAGAIDTARAINLPSTPGAAAASDFDGDGLLDLAYQTASLTVDVIHIRDGHVLTTLVIDSTASVIAAHDLDRDGRQDLVVALAGPTIYDHPTVRVFHNDGAGSFIRWPDVLPPYRVVQMDFVDLDGDGHDELVLTSDALIGSFRRVMFYSIATNGIVSEFAPGITFPGTFVACGELTGDSRGDILVRPSVGAPDGFDLYAGDGSGGFGTAHPLSCGATSVSTTALADLDDDGDLDIVCGFSSPGGVSITRNLGMGSFATAVSWSSQLLGTAMLQVADFDGDGITDILGCEHGGASALMMRGRNAGVDYDILPAEGIAEDLSHLFAGEIDGSPGIDACALRTWSSRVPILENVWSSHVASVEANHRAGHSPLLIRRIQAQIGTNHAVWSVSPAGVHALTARIMDSQGRVARHLEPERVSVSHARLEWDGRDEFGRRCAAGLYWLTVDDERTHAAERFVLLR